MPPEPSIDHVIQESFRGIRHASQVRLGSTSTIEGASNHSKHKNQVPIIAWSWGASNTGNLHTGAGYAAGGKANIQDISITKYVDSCSNALLNACCTGARVDNATCTSPMPPANRPTS